MKTRCLALLLSCLALPIAGARAQIQAGPPVTVQSLDDSHVVLDDFDLLLLYLARTGRSEDLVALAQAGGAIASESIRGALDAYARAGDARERFRRRTVLESALDERRRALAGARPLLMPLASTLGAYDAATCQIPLSLRLDGSAEREPGRRCAPQHVFGSEDVLACVATDGLTSADPIFSAIPVPDPQTANELRKRHAQGRLQMYAIAIPAGTPQTTALPPATQWTQPVRIGGLMLVDKDSGRVFAVARAQGDAPAATGSPLLAASPPAAAAPAAAGTGAGAGAGPGAALPGQPNGPLAGGPPAAPGGPQGPSGVQPQPGQPRAPGEVPNPVQDGAPVPDLDRLLSLFSYTVYGSPEKYTLAKAEIAKLEATMARIGKDSRRGAGVKATELKSLALKLDTARQALAELDRMLRLKASATGSGKAAEVPIDRALRTNKVYFEHYRLRDGRHVIAFRGTDNRHDVSTDFDLVANPATLGELASHVANGKGGAKDAAAGWLQEQADQQIEADPAAFQGADAVVAALIRSGVKPARVIVTGHSLGGGLAQYAGLRNHVATIVTFNPAPLNASLMAKLPAGARGGTTELRHYVAFVPPATPDGAGTFDPVSQGLALMNGTLGVYGLANAESLQVIGERHIVNVCSDLTGPDYAAFRDGAQSAITGLTVATMGVGRSGMVHAATALGGAYAAGHAETDRMSAATTGAMSARKTATVVSAGMNCYKHPFLCAAAAAGGGIMSAAATMQLPQIWALYNAHRMRNMYEALNGEMPPACMVAAGYADVQ